MFSLLLTLSCERARSSSTTALITHTKIIYVCLYLVLHHGHRESFGYISFTPMVSRTI